MRQHRRDAGHVLHDVVRDVAHPLGQGVKIHWFDNLKGDKQFIATPFSHVNSVFMDIQWCPYLVYPDLVDCRDLVD